jgi:hypothetical protein
MECQAVVETLLDESFEVVNGLGSDLRIKFDHHFAAVGIDDCVMAGVAHG